MNCVLEITQTTCRRRDNNNDDDDVNEPDEMKKKIEGKYKVKAFMPWP